MIRPIWPKMLMRMPAMNSAPLEPMMANGSDIMMVNGWMRLSNCEAKIM